MNKTGIVLGMAVFAMLLSTNNEANAQHRKLFSKLKPSTPVYSGVDANGMTMTDYTKRIPPRATLRMAAQNPYTPSRLYTYSNDGVLAQRTHIWNQNESLARPWNGEYMNWRWRVPTALIVPPTAAYQTSYGWGVGQVRSTPIHHQFSPDDGSGVGGSGVGGGGPYAHTPYWPSSTDQFGIYPVRSGW